MYLFLKRGRFISHEGADTISKTLMYITSNVSPNINAINLITRSRHTLDTFFRLIL